MSEAGAAGNGPATDLYIASLQRETQHRQNGELTPIAAILPRVMADLADRMAAAALDYEVCEHCHRASWSHIEHLIESARRDERERIEWDLKMADLDSREPRLELIRAMLRPQPKGERRYLDVSA